MQILISNRAIALDEKGQTAEAFQNYRKSFGDFPPSVSALTIWRGYGHMFQPVFPNGTKALSLQGKRSTFMRSNTFGAARIGSRVCVEWAIGKAIEIARAAMQLAGLKATNSLAGRFSKKLRFMRCVCPYRETAE